MNTKTYFCDTYALLEIIGGNPAYQEYTNQELTTSTLNIMELYYALLRDYGKDIAEYYLAFWSILAVDIPRQIIPNAMHFKLKYKKERLSYIDCMGYIFSRQQNIPFLTGDSKFKGREQVEFMQ